MRWAILLIFLLSVQLAMAEFSTFSVTPSSGDTGTQVSVFAQWESANSATIYLETESINLDDKICFSGTVCTLQATLYLNQNTIFTARADFQSGAIEPIEEYLTFTLLNPGSNVNPTVELVQFNPILPSVGDDVEIDILAQDTDQNLNEVRLVVDGSIIDTYSCHSSPSSCSNTFVYSFQTAKDYDVLIVAEDDLGLEDEYLERISVKSGTDFDGDGVLNTYDACSTTPSDMRPVATIGEYAGCACDEVDPSNIDNDYDICTIEVCDIQNNQLVIIHTPVANGQSPPNSAGTCVDGEYIAIGECASGDTTICYGDTGDKHPYCFDGVSPYNRIETCDSGEVCVASPDGAYCSMGEPCLASPGCLPSQPSNTDIASGVCENSYVCYECTSGFFWNGQFCELDQCTTRYYNDADGDGQGNPQTGICVNQHPNPVTNGLDCNDNNANAYVGAIEFCDGIDNNCNNVVDDNCVQATCPSCDIEPEVTFFWENDLCVEREYQNTTSFTPISCAPCEYSDQSTITPTLNTRDRQNYSACTDGLCQAGICIPLCTHRCLSGTPENAVVVTSQICQNPSDTCYRCASNLVWDGLNCANTGYQIRDAGSIIIENKKTFTLAPKLFTDEGAQVAAVFTYRGLIDRKTRDPITILADGVGVKSLSITASRLQGTQEIESASKNIDVTVLCTSKDVCCVQGTANLKANGANCPGGTCSNGECVVACQATFENSPSTCSDGIDNDCDGHIDCQESNGQVEESCRPFCSAFCSVGKKDCAGKCIDTKTNHDNCGACGVSCTKTEVCQAGTCIDQGLECFVACSEDRDCGEGVCREAGTCEAYCEETDLLELEEEEQVALLSDVIRQRTYSLEKTLTDDEFSLTFTNLIGAPLENVTFLITIPKDMVLSASSIKSDYPFDIIHDDPVIKTTIPVVQGKQEISYYLPPVNPADLDRIIVETKHALIDPTKAKKLTNDDLVIRTSFDEANGKTKINLLLNPGANLKDVRIPLEIPKCLATSMSEIEFEQDNYEVINDDPLMVWTFDVLNAQEELSFSIPKSVDDDCRDQLQAFGLASDKSKPFNPWIPVGIIPIIGVVLVFFQRFHEKGVEHLDKKEFTKLAREQGQTDAEIERSWAEYKRRF